MFSKTKENILFLLIVIAIIIITAKALTITGRYDEMINNLEKKIEACRTEIPLLKAEDNEIAQTEIGSISIGELEKKLINHKHRVKDGEVIF